MSLSIHRKSNMLTSYACFKQSKSQDMVLSDKVIYIFFFLLFLSFSLLFYACKYANANYELRTLDEKFLLENIYFLNEKLFLSSQSKCFSVLERRIYGYCG